MKQGGPAENPEILTRCPMAYYEEDYFDFFESENNDDYCDYQTYDDYNGSYVQDVEGWSDQMIDEVFDGDPEAYWNLD